MGSAFLLLRNTCNPINVIPTKTISQVSSSDADETERAYMSDFRRPFRRSRVEKVGKAFWISRKLVCDSGVRCLLEDGLFEMSTSIVKAVLSMTDGMPPLLLVRSEKERPVYKA